MPSDGILRDWLTRFRRQGWRWCSSRNTFPSWSSRNTSEKFELPTFSMCPPPTYEERSVAINLCTGVTDYKYNSTTFQIPNFCYMTKIISHRIEREPAARTEKPIQSISEGAMTHLSNREPVRRPQSCETLWKTQATLACLWPYWQDIISKVIIIVPHQFQYYLSVYCTRFST